ncbi:B12-binding domain-containing radical SAM protein [Lachnospiraceae bacterium 66-29]
MKILLTAINAKYIHSNLAVYSLRAYAREYQKQIQIAEYTINHRVEYLLQELYKQKPDVLCFSCYIWNIRYVQEVITEFHKLLPNVPIWVGGPEVSYESEAFLRSYPMVTGVMIGEGEATFRELCSYYIEHKDTQLQQIKGLLIRTRQGTFVRTAKRELLDLNQLPFCYENLEDFNNRMIYYETSRGCPYSCSYCLSSIEKGLRFRSLERVKQELQFFLDHQVPQVKFVDRTFNCNHRHCTEIWQYLKEHDNGITNFHFEISADLLTEEELSLIASLRPGLIQLEIGVQSTYGPTIQEICRTMNLPRLETVVAQIRQAGNIHQHLDLIAGLPKEGFANFKESFRQVYAMKPQQLQLGFLKVLKGSDMYRLQGEYGIVFQEYPPYEVRATRWLTYEEILKIKLVEEMLEVYYNSGQFELTIKVLELTEENPFELFLNLGKFYERRGLLAISHSRMRRCEILLDYIEETDSCHQQLYQETLTFDLYQRENMKSRPAWAPELSTFKEISRTYCKKGKLSHLEPFWYDMEMIRQAKTLTDYPDKNETCNFYLFCYQQRNALTKQAQVTRMEGIEC